MTAPYGPARHGTMSGYNKHIKRKETVCGACRAHADDWREARKLRVRSDYFLSMGDALARLGLPPDRVPAEVTPS